MSRYSIKPNAGKDLNGCITNFRIADEFDPAWLESNEGQRQQREREASRQRPSMVGFKQGQNEAVTIGGI